jgi:hypothetical protein
LTSTFAKPEGKITSIIIKDAHSHSDKAAAYGCERAAKRISLHVRVLVLPQVVVSHSIDS